MILGIEQLSHIPGMWLWRGRFLYEGPASIDNITMDRIERMTTPLLEAEVDGWHVWVPTPGKAWASRWTACWPNKPPKPYFPSWEDYRRARREDKLLWIHQFLVEFNVPQSEWDNHIKRIVKVCR